MARRKYSGPLAMDLFRPLERDSPALLSDQLTDRIVRLVATGRLTAGSYLPPIRLLASKLHLNVGTIERACEGLHRQGIVITDSTRGLRVTPAGAATQGKVGRPWAGLVMRPATPVDPLGPAPASPSGDALVRFHVSEPGTDLMPADLIARAFASALRDRGVLRYAPAAGLPETHDALAGYLRQRGVALAGGEVLLTTGTTQSLAIVTRAFLPAGGIVLTEHPTWHVALSVFAAAGARVVALPVDDAGMHVASLRDVVLRHNPSFLYLQPTFQNPTGTSLSAERRAELVALARKLQLPVVEDDFAGELAFGAAIPPLRTADGADTVVYLKSFAKLLAPSCRVGVIVTPTRHAEAFRSVRNGLDPFVSAITQRALAECLTSAAFESHVRSLAASLHRRWQALDRALRRRMPQSVRWTRPVGGLCAWMELPPQVRPGEFVRDAAKRGVPLAPGRLFCVDDSGEHGLRLAFAATTPEEIERGVRIIGELLEARARSRRRPASRSHGVAP